MKMMNLKNLLKKKKKMKTVKKLTKKSTNHLVSVLLITKKGSADKASGIGTPGKAKHNESVEITEEDEDDKEDVDEDIDLEEVIAALSEEEDDEDEKNEVAELKSDLDEHRNVVKYLRSKLNEVNLLNAKLLFTNKLFRSYGLTNDQKMKVVENFDRAHNLVKLNWYIPL